MPRALRFSRRLIDKLGDDAAGELVDMLNSMELTQRGEFRELFDSRFGTLEARLAQHTAEVRAEFRVALTEQKSELQGEFKSSVSDLRDRMSSSEKRLIGWMFGFWIGTVATMLAILRS